MFAGCNIWYTYDAHLYDVLQQRFVNGKQWKYENK